MDALKVEEWINHTRDANGGVISPEFAMEILTKTNHFAHIKKTINYIKKSCTDEKGELVTDKVLAYKDFILSSVDEREMSPQALDGLKDLAEKGVFVDEFNEANQKKKYYLKDDCYKVVNVKTKEDFEALEGEDLKIFFDADMVDLYHCDLGKVKNLRFKEGADINLWGVQNFPKNLDVSMGSCVFVSDCNLDGVNLKFREGARVNLSHAYNLPKNLDVSMCSWVNMLGCDLEGFNLKFREGARVYLSEAQNLSKNLDVSMCGNVDLRETNLEGISLKFREGARVFLNNTKNLQKELDLSMCEKVDMSGCDLSGVEQIKFKDKKQEKEFMDGAKNFNGKVEYQSLFNKIGKFINKEM